MRRKWKKRGISILVFLGLLTGCMTSDQSKQITIIKESTRIQEKKTAAIPVEETEQQQIICDEPQQIEDMSEKYEWILNHVTKEFISGYMVNESFLMWIQNMYGNEVIDRLVEEVQKEEQDVALWYELTGKSIHVLWLTYCGECGFEQYRLENTYWKECKSEEEAVISFVGDINFAEEWHTMKKLQEQENGIYDCFSPELRELMTESDVLVVNNEFAYIENGTPLAGKTYTFAADTDKVELLENLGVDLASLGNNHVYDYGEEGLLSTIHLLEAQGIPYVGAGKNLQEAEKSVSYVLNGKKIAIIAATEIERTKTFTKEATEQSAGVLKMLNPDKFIRVIEQAAQTNDYVIAIAHWGTEGKIFFEEEEIRYAQQLVDAGASAVIGGHPHRLQGVSFLGDSPIAYSLGNFWFSTGSLYTTVAQIVISKEGELTLRYQPCIQENLTTRLLTGQEEKEEFFDYLAAISYNIGVDADGVIYNMAEESICKDRILYDASDAKYQNCHLSGQYDNNGNAIDSVGNLK